MQTVAPREERILAEERPMPDAPPVMAMILSFMDILMQLVQKSYIEKGGGKCSLD